MKAEIDYFFCLRSPWAFLGIQRMNDIVARHNTLLNYKPVKIRKVFEATGGVTLTQRSRQRKAYRLMELKRWSDYLGINLNLAPRFEFPETDFDAARTVIAAIQRGYEPGKLVSGYLRGMWIEDRDISDPPTIRSIIAESGYDSEFLLQTSCEPKIEAIFEANTQEAIKKGVFGIPAWVLNGELFWGQDRLEFLDRRLAMMQDSK
jgi:2-hydroxychromene-2-carboxylate isomerase|tara:strand:+ start:110 stop:724 length:615 start_codon:yes stop_codon:yes gene_type:complete